MKIQSKNILPLLSAKELADELHVSIQYVYAMKSCGFKMPWDATAHCYAATLDEAQQWLELTQFRIVKGKGRVNTETRPA